VEIELVLAIGIMIVAGFFGGKLAHAIRFPMITGYNELVSPPLVKYAIFKAGEQHMDKPVQGAI